MLVVDPKKRLTAQDVLKHKWFTTFASGQKLADEVDDLDPDVFKKMRSFKSTSYFEMLARNILIKQQKDGEFTQL